MSAPVYQWDIPSQTISPTCNLCDWGLHNWCLRILPNHTAGFEIPCPNFGAGARSALLRSGSTSPPGNFQKDVHPGISGPRKISGSAKLWWHVSNYIPRHYYEHGFCCHGHQSSPTTTVTIAAKLIGTFKAQRTRRRLRLDKGWASRSWGTWKAASESQWVLDAAICCRLFKVPGCIGYFSAKGKPLKSTRSQWLNSNTGPASTRCSLPAKRLLNWAFRPLVGSPKAFKRSRSCCASGHATMPQTRTVLTAKLISTCKSLILFIFFVIRHIMIYYDVRVLSL